MFSLYGISCTSILAEGRLPHQVLTHPACLPSRGVAALLGSPLLFSVFIIPVLHPFYAGFPRHGCSLPGGVSQIQARGVESPPLTCCSSFISMLLWTWVASIAGSTLSSSLKPDMFSLHFKICITCVKAQLNIFFVGHTTCKTTMVNCFGKFLGHLSPA